MTYLAVLIADVDDSVCSVVDLTSPAGHVNPQSLAYILQDQLDAINQEIRWLFSALCNHMVACLRHVGIFLYLRKSPVTFFFHKKYYFNWQISLKIPDELFLRYCVQAANKMLPTEVCKKTLLNIDMTRAQYKFLNAVNAKATGAQHQTLPVAYLHLSRLSSKKL